MSIGKLLGALEGDPKSFPRHLWEFDDIENWSPYKDFFTKFRGSGGAELDSSTKSILLSDGSPESSAQPVELSSFLFKSMGEEKVSVRRIFVHHSVANKINSLLAKFKLS